MSNFTLDTLRNAILNSVTIAATSDMIPTAGEGTPVAPAVFAKGDNHPGGPAITRDAAQRYVNDAGEGVVRRDDSGAPILGNTVMIDSVFSQNTHNETHLWELRAPEYLDLPGIIFNTPVRADIEASVAKHYPKIAAKSSSKVQTVESATEMIVGELETVVPTMSSWTLAHRHVDGAIRSSVDADGNTLWHDGGEVYTRLQNASPSHLSDLLKFSPNAVLFGFWAAAMPVRHRLARNINSTVTGYGATRLTGGSVKSTPIDISSHLEIDTKGAVTYKEKSDEKKRPSTWGLGAVPSTGTHLVTCDTIIADTYVSVAQLRRVLRSSDLTDEQADAATVALASLGILAHTMTLESGFYRSGCDLVDRSTTWRSVHRGGDTILDIPMDSAALIPVVREALGDARALGVIGTSTESITVDMGQTMLDAVVCSSIEQLVKRSEGEAE